MSTSPLSLPRPGLARLLALLVAALLLTGSAGAEWRPAALFGGDVRSLAVSPDDPDLVVAGTSAGEVYRSRDGGASWYEPGRPVPFRGYVVAALAFDAERPERLWLGAWGLWGSGLVAYSDTQGAVWQTVFSGVQVYSLAVAPGRPGRVYAGTREGVYGSDDDGESWRRLGGEVPGVGKVSSLLVPPGEPGSILAGTWRLAYRSDDLGASWRQIGEGMYFDSEVFELAPAPGADGTIWAATCGWVYRSRDGGESWEGEKEGMETRRTPSFLALPDGTLLAGTVGGLYRSTDGGRSWELRTPPDLAVLTLAAHPERPERVLLGSEGAGVWSSVDGGRSFALSSEGMRGLRVAALASRGRELLVAVSDAGPLSGVYSSYDGGESFYQDPVRLPRILALGRDGDRVLARTVAGGFERVDGRWRRAAGEVATEDGLSATGAAPSEIAGGPPLPADRVTATLVHDGHVWVGTRGHGLWVRPTHPPAQD